MLVMPSVFLVTLPASEATAAAPASTATLVTSAAPSTPSALAPTTALPRMLASTTLRANDEDDRKKRCRSIVTGVCAWSLQNIEGFFSLEALFALARPHTL
eukprot:683265-Amphidinium_carterae.1